MDLRIGIIRFSDLKVEPTEDILQFLPLLLLRLLYLMRS
jgi:hypothetical protein